MNFWLETNLCDLLDGRWGTNEIDDPLVDSELEVVIGLSTVTAWSPPGCDPKPPPWHWDWATNGELLLLQSLDKIAANLLEVWKLGGCDSKADALGWLLLSNFLLLVSGDVDHVKRPNQPLQKRLFLCDVMNLSMY